MFGWPTPISFVNARVVTPEGEARSIRVRRRVLGLDEPPHPGDHVIDLDGRFVLPGLINAHDHLELNHYGPLTRRERYANAREWIADLTPCIRESPEIRAKSRLPLADRLFVGGIKNVLSGVTTVAHHNPRYQAFGLHYPVRLLEGAGWAHSLGLEHGPVGAHGEPGGVVAEVSANTPADRPFIVHAAEGVDSLAAHEIDDLEASGSLRPNTVLVHGLAVTPQRWSELFARGVSLVWCPASNQRLFGCTVCAASLFGHPLARHRVCLGTDSRLTGSRDLLDELRVAAAVYPDAAALLRMVTSSAAEVLRMGDAGRLALGAPADLTVIPALASTAATSLLACRRADVALVVRRGTPVVGALDLRAAFEARRIHVRGIDVDGVPRLIQAGLARRLARCSIAEPGVRTVES
jgi:cytosine/adenosine deaminase-related metal-dependent hydrolase